MNLYSNKKRWKWLLFSSAALIFVIIIYMSHLLLQDIAASEREKVKLWADAVSAKAELVNHTEEFFEKIKVEEGKRATLLVKAMRKVTEASWNEDLTFYADIISSNSSIPSIITKENGDINYCVNVDTAVTKMKNIAELGEQRAEYDSVKFLYFKNEYCIVYYKESQIYSQLRVMLDNLIKSFFQEVVINNTAVPVIITDSTRQNVITSGNLDSVNLRTEADWQQLIAKMEGENLPIKIFLPEQGACFVFYEESAVLTQLRFFPYIQFGIIAIFFIIAYLLFSFARRSEQNQVWVGMSKETAHQLGTPISSLMAWTELLKEQPIEQSIPNEIDKDVRRLETIAQRFSKIGSVPELKPENLITILNEFVQYLQSRVSKKITIKLNVPDNQEVTLPINRPLFEWVIENLCKNAVDAIEGVGVIIVHVSVDEKFVQIDVSDTGKGIPAKKHKAIFKPGFTSKRRGWGLGLTLAKRIVEEYHKGRLFVASSVIGKGTTMRIVLHK